MQCSNCSHTWFQMHPDAMTEEPEPTEGPLGKPHPSSPVPPDDSANHTERAAALDDDAPWDDDDLTEPTQAGGQGADSIAAAVSGAVPRRQELNEDVAAILREEADREAQVRRAEALSLDPQGDMGFDQTPQRGSSGPEKVRFADPYGDDEASGKSGTRIRTLPDIDQINTTLSPPEEPDDDADEEDLQTADAAEKRGFRRGFALTLLIGAILLAVYAFTPQLVERAPALEPALGRYAAMIDAGRVWLDDMMKGIISSINASQQ